MKPHTRRTLKICLAVGALVLMPMLLPSASAASEVGARTFVFPDTRLGAVAGKIERSVLATLQAGASVPALIVLKEQADLSAARNLQTKQEKGRYVFNTLRATAARTQAQLRALLDARGLTYRAFYVANVIAVENLSAADAALIAARPEVRRIAGNPEMRLEPPASRAPAPEAAAGIEWGIAKIRADKLWALGIKGKGIVVANQDTGVQWTHPALKNQYRGYDKKTGKATHSYNWWDAIHQTLGGGSNPCGVNTVQPCDDNGHGTHTLGTLVGGVGDNKIGVAPRARWISCRDMDRGVGRPSTYIECFEFFLAPWDKRGNNPKPDLAPDVISNSWGCLLGAPPAGEGCNVDSLKTVTENVRAAGIFVAVSAGNSGSNCKTITDPAAIYNAATTIGATDNRDELAGFSSRGPVKQNGANLLKPDLSAPGVNVRSAYPTNGYEVLSGTSMAAPHVAGAVALLWQAKPGLRGNVNATEKALFGGANRNVQVAGNPKCGGTQQDDIPNNLFGYGRLDVWRAYQNAP